MTVRYKNSLGAISAAGCGGEIECYVCGSIIPDDSVNWGFAWGSDGIYPDGASAMYACWDCRKHWIDPLPDNILPSEETSQDG